MGYRHKYVIGHDYAFYNNSESLEDNVNFNYCGLDLVHSDSFIPVFEDVATLTKDIISGTDYRFYADTFTFPTVQTGCYRFIIMDLTDSTILYISNKIEVVDSDTDLMYVNFRNAKNILNYNYEGLTTYENKTHVEMFNRKPLRPVATEGYKLSDGSFKRVRTLLTKSFEFVTGWFDESEHDAMQEMIIHSQLNIAMNGNFELINLVGEAEYVLDWQDNYEFIQASIRLEIDDRSSSNKAL